MATLVFTALGNVVGGPIGAAVGSLLGSRIDRALLGGGTRREGPRLKEVALTTASYGTPLPRHFGTMRAPGTLIWATDLVESRETSGGGKGRPSTTTYSYSASFAVALASRPIRRVGRIWADGNLLRGAAGDLKAGGQLRIHLGHGDQPPDPLIASAQGTACPAFRGLAYCVFESLQLADFGNRIPTLSFEIVADDGEVTLARLVEPLGAGISSTGELPGLAGFSDEGGPLAAVLATVGQVYPLTCDAGGDALTIWAGQPPVGEPPLLPEAAVDLDDEAFGGVAGQTGRRGPDARAIPGGLRYYDPARDYQIGLQRAEGRARPGRSSLLDFPGALDAATARRLANAAAERAASARETLAWRVAELDPSLAAGAVVRVPGDAGRWRIDTWEWREKGIELQLRRLPRGPSRQTPADAGQALAAQDLVATPTKLAAFEVPWDGVGEGGLRRIHAAVSSASGGWSGAALYAEMPDGLVPLGASGAQRSILGHLASSLGPSMALRLERAATVDVELVSADFGLTPATPETIANGANRALIGGEVVQFAEAAPLGGSLWRLRGLLRGRGGTEAAAQAAHPTGTPFVVLDEHLVVLDPAQLGSATSVAAIGLADNEPVSAPIVNPGLFLRPLAPVHPRLRTGEGGSLVIEWTRRARGAWTWPDAIEAPLNEQFEEYLIGLGSTTSPDLRWHSAQPRLELSAAILAELEAAHSGKRLWVRQVGSFAVSDPLLLTQIA